MKNCLLFNVGLLALWEYESLHLARPSCNGLKINSFLYIVDFVGDLFVLRVVDYLLSEIEKSIFANTYIHTRMHCEIM